MDMEGPEIFYKYTPIDLATNAIRVLRLCRGYDTDPITCELAQIFLEDDGVPYEALSYTWGNTIVDVEVTLEGKKKMVKDNLYTALHCLRRADEDRWLWVDALCIDQDDPKEKTHQVHRMRRIYEKADRVLIWLGRTTQEIDLLMEMMKQLGKRTRRRADYRKDEATAWLEEWPQFIRELGGMSTEFNVQRRNGLMEMLSRPWFQRVWVLQEAFNAKRATILCGWNDILTETFVVMPTLFGMEVEPHAQAVLDIMPGYLRRVSWRSEETDLRTLLRRFHQSQASDSRDKIYALLGIASDARADGKLQADYAVSPTETIRRAIHYLMFGESSDTWICPLPGWDFNTLVENIDSLPPKVLQWAIDYGKETTAREVLARTKININAAPTGGDAPLLQIAGLRDVLDLHRKASLQILRMLLAHPDIDVNVKDSSGNTALHIAVASGNSAAAAELVQRPDVDPNQCNSKGETPLALAIESGHELAIRTLLGHPSTTIDFPPDSEMPNPLHLAVMHNRPSVVPLLLQAGANIESRDSNGETPLYLAARLGRHSVVEGLLAAGANIEARDSMLNAPPLYGAVSKGHADVFKLLLSAGATIDDGRLLRSKRSVLWAAAEKGDEEIVLAILERKDTLGTEYLELKDGFEKGTALWIACNRGHYWVVKHLLDAGADIHSPDSLKHTPLWTAIRNDHLNVGHLLVERGAVLQKGDHVVDSESLRSDPRKPAPFRISDVAVNKVFGEAGWDASDIESMVKYANGKTDSVLVRRVPVQAREPQAPVQAPVRRRKRLYED